MALTTLAPSPPLISKLMSASSGLSTNMISENVIPASIVSDSSLLQTTMTSTSILPENAMSAILCVDDEMIILDSLREQLERHFGDGYVYEVAENVKEAWWIIEDLCESGVRVLVIVSDWLMPDIRGDEFLIQVHQRFPQIVTIMLTGQADTEAIERAKSEANLRACLRKPWREEELIDLVGSALS